ncbi:LytR/AlgR family response regulator transcription factor [Desulfotomaculum copahuensis]|uniref:Stage 0 sporulation protein A homolog n=1 Tax=Desulfotomaculum copahuensis TaxID=1838280 RepID=A0A1B7LKI2_9FIRM|nr:LytTR family DNA-binding domain-containing protein [Desulfotomaculum copahuensis]OAT87068.1 DNA-binding response regulator [Desulfotomaculum copahuensis]
MKLKALIVDDEYPARQELRYALSEFDNVEIVGEAANAQEALALIKALDYQVIFLDISMPGMNGLELGAAIQDLPRQPQVIFVTAYDEYAVRAFEVNAVDYLLKPVEHTRLKKAIDKVVRITQESMAASEAAAAGEADAPHNGSQGAQPAGQIKIDRIPAEKQGKTVLVAESDIIYAFTEQDYIYVKTFADKLFTRFTLKELEARLNPAVFFRTHRCYLVNLHKVREIVPFFNGTYNLVVEDKENSEVPVSRAQAKKLRKILGF